MDTQNMHHAILSLREELEAIDLYALRADICTDDNLRAVLLHNRGEEIEHAMMLLEWLRRSDPIFDVNAKKYLFTSPPIVAIESAGPAPATSLGIGTLKGKPWTS